MGIYGYIRVNFFTFFQEINVKCLELPDLARNTSANFCSLAHFNEGRVEGLRANPTR